MFDFFVTPWTIVCHAPLFMGFPRKEYCSGLPFPPLGDLPHPGIEHESPALAGGFFTTEPLGKPRNEQYKNGLIVKQTISFTVASKRIKYLISLNIKYNTCTLNTKKHCSKKI